MNAETNKSIIRHYFDVVTGQREDRALADFFAGDVEWRVPQSNPDIRPNPRVGHAAVMDLLTSGVGIYRPGSMTVHLDRLIADDDHVVAQFSLDATLANGNDYLNRYVFVFRLRNGLIDRVYEYLDTLYQWNQGAFEAREVDPA